MFCTCLRKRQEWAPVIPILLQNRPLKFRETKLETHDVAIQAQHGPAKPTQQQQQQPCFRFILLSAVDMKLDETDRRVERLCHLTGGNDVAIVFLLGKNGDPSSFVQFQIDIMGKFGLPLIPLASLQELPSTLMQFYEQHLSSLQLSATRNTLSMSAVQTLLPHCSIRPPLREHSVNVLSDITSSCADLVSKATTEEGRSLLAEYLDPQEAEGVILFWESEFMFDGV